MALGTASKDIIIKIKGDNKNFNSAIAKTDSSMKGFAGKMKQHSGAIKAGLIGIGVAATAAFALAIKSTISYGVEVDKVRKITGMTAETITSLAYAAEQEHTSLDALQTGWRRLSRAMSDADEGLAESKRTFDALGISIYDNEGQLKSMESMTLEISDAFAGMQNDTKKAALAQELFGRSGSEMIPFLEMGAEKIRDLQEVAVELGIVMSDEMVDNSKQFGDQMTFMSFALKGVAVSLGTELLPPLIEFSDNIIKLIGQGWLKRFTAGLSMVGKTAYVAYDSFKILNNTIEAYYKLSRLDFEGYERLKEDTQEAADRLSKSYEGIAKDLDVLVNGPLQEQKELLDDIKNTQDDINAGLGEQQEKQEEINKLYSQSLGMRQAKKGISKSDWAARAADIASGRLTGGDIPSAQAGGYVREGGLVKVHTGENIIPPGQSTTSINITTGDIVNRGDLDYLTNKIKSAVMAGGG